MKWPRRVLGFDDGDFFVVIDPRWRDKLSPRGPNDGFTDDEREQLRQVHDSSLPGRERPEIPPSLRLVLDEESRTQFVAACWRIRERYDRNLDSLPSPRPTEERRRLRKVRKALKAARTAPQWRQALAGLRLIDAARIARIAPEIKPRQERVGSPRLIAVVRALEEAQRGNKRNANYAEQVAALRVRRLFERLGMGFTDYGSDAYSTRGAAAIVLAIILRAAPNRSMRPLIRFAKDPGREGRFLTMDGTDRPDPAEMLRAGQRAIIEGGSPDVSLPDPARHSLSDVAARPGYLPDFRNPPINEVVIGVQFNPIPGYQQILACEVWNLFRDRYPDVEEHPPIAPTFETFGLPGRGPQPQLTLMTGAPRCRFWFKRADGTELIQFQEDRLLHNWRKVASGTNEYPRYESMMREFSDEVRVLEAYLSAGGKRLPDINQCEISYINHIQAANGEPLKPEDWLRFIEFGSRPTEDFAVGFRQIIPRDAPPQGRLIVEATTAIAGSAKIIALNLTVRGAPKHPTLESAIDFLNLGREVIVTEFTEMTTDEAHKAWERVQ